MVDLNSAHKSESKIGRERHASPHIGQEGHASPYIKTNNITILYEYIHQLINAPTSTSTHFPSLVLLSFICTHFPLFVLTSLHLYSLTFTLVSNMWASMTFLPKIVLYQKNRQIFSDLKQSSSLKFSCILKLLLGLA